MPRIGYKITGGVQACQRCRHRKQKCDQRYPQCSGCERADVPCLSYDCGKQADVPRDYILRLEEKIRNLTQENQTLRQVSSGSPETHRARDIASVESVPDEADVQSIRPSPSDEGSPLVRDLVTSVKDVVVQRPQAHRFLGQSSGISFAKMVMSAIHVNKLPPPLAAQPPPSYKTSSDCATKASLPPRHVADHLIDVYFQYRTPHLPILSRSQVARAVNRAYEAAVGATFSRAPPTDRDLFIAYMVFAIALVDVPHPSGGRSSQSDGCFRSATAWIETSLTYSRNDLETLRAVLLLAQFVALSPKQGSLWHLTGFALRLCIDAGLHWEAESQSVSMDPEELDDQRRLWHCTYYFDRMLAVTLGRPFGITDESICVQLPNPWTGSRSDMMQPVNDFDLYARRAHNHILTLTRLESEIKQVHHAQTWPSARLASPRPNWKAWLQGIQPRLQEWQATIPDPKKAHPSSIFCYDAYWDVIYYNAVLLLYRPHSAGAHVSSEELLICFEASTRVIAGLKILQRDGRVEMLWKSVYQIFLAGLGVIYGIWRSGDVRSQYSVSTCIATLQSCSSTLSAMSETFQGASGCRNAFDALSSATINWLVTKDTEDARQSRLEFEGHVNDLSGHLQLPREETVLGEQHGMDNMLGILSTEYFDLSEILNDAAQWPGPGELDFIMNGCPEAEFEFNIDIAGSL
ncbi:fungal-specific transcription factor domain-containing protein [Plectosphaerella plurivora]|uniref:Fungal-specific transcription factor domain-containing protein n=1 Tax=Plectosphaerella plurivora TaxID=936078 RepID=A0A9P9A990_9PEZI|nr:fungal-specific transcription factor domain-containing protein [Plectosphaerella plurivora]